MKSKSSMEATGNRELNTRVRRSRLKHTASGCGPHLSLPVSEDCAVGGAPSGRGTGPPVAPEVCALLAFACIQ